MEPDIPPTALKREVHKSPERLVSIEVYVCLTAAGLTFLVLFGLFRRRYHSKLFSILVWTAYVMCAELISYTMGQMQSASFHNELFTFWVTFFIIVHGTADSISAYSLEDNEHRKRYNWQHLVQSYWVLMLLPKYSEKPKFLIVVFLILGVFGSKMGERVRTYMLASRSAIARNTKLIMDFMGYEHELSNPNEIDPTQMKGYNYLVRGERKIKVEVTPPHYRKRLDIQNDKVITVQKIWQCRGTLLALTDSDDRLKDICLSFALYKLICRRFAGYPLLECRHEKTWRFVRNGLLYKEGDYERVFRVIEVELAFLFDLFYTKYPAIFQRPGERKYKFLGLLSVIIGCSVAVSILRNYQTPPGQINLKVGEHNIDVLVTSMVLLAIVSLEVLQIAFIISSDWVKVILLCKYVQKPSWQASKHIEKMIEFICRAQLFKHWRGKLGQYSLLKSFNYEPSRWLYNFLTGAFLDKPSIGRKESAPIKVPAEVKKAIILSLKINGRTLSNGEASLRQNRVENKFSWACRLETNTHVLMVWHIATSLCEIDALSKSVSPGQREHFIVATGLSKYCAYLVAFAPGFLPGNAYVSEFDFDQIVKETRNFLKECETREKMFNQMMLLADGGNGNTVIQRGAVLGKRLLREIENGEQRYWKILAEFWAEMMLFVAPSDDATIHAEYLAKGGEFVTHLWALLSHAGILKRDSAVPEI